LNWLRSSLDWLRSSLDWLGRLWSSLDWLRSSLDWLGRLRSSLDGLRSRLDWLLDDPLWDLLRLSWDDPLRDLGGLRLSWSWESLRLGLCLRRTVRSDWLNGEGVVVDWSLDRLSEWSGTLLSEWLEHEESVGWRGTSWGRGWCSSRSWCWSRSRSRSRSRSWSWSRSWSRSRSRSRSWSWSWGLSWSLRSVDLDLSNVWDVERLEVELDSASRDDRSRPGPGSGRSGGEGLECGPHGLTGLGSSCGHHWGGAGTGWSRTVLEIELNSALDILLESGLEGSAVLVEGDGAGEGVRVGLSIVLLELDGRAVESEAVQLRIKVERSGLGWSGSDPDWSSSRDWSPGRDWSSSWYWGSSWDWSSSGGGSPLGISVGSEVCELRVSGGLLLRRLGWLSLDRFPWPGSGWDLVIGQLLLHCLSEPLLGVHWVLDTHISVQSLELLFVIIVSAGQA